MTHSRKRNVSSLGVFGLLAVTLPLLSTTVVEAAPWVDDTAGHGFIQLSYVRYQASEYFAGPGEQKQSGLGGVPAAAGSKKRIQIPIPGGFGTVNLNSNYVDQDAFLYGTVSLGKRFAALVQMPLVRYITQDLATAPQHSTLSTFHQGDLTFGIKEQLPTIKALPGFAFGPQLYLTAPTGDVNASAKYPAAVMSSGNLPMPTGNGTWDITALGSFGYSFYPVPVFVSADVGIHHHLDNAVCKQGNKSQSITYSDDVPYNVQLGAQWEPKKKGFHHALLIATFSGQKSLENGYVPPPASKAGPFTDFCGQQNNSSAFNIGGTIMLFPIKQLGVTYTIAHTIVGINTGYGLTNSVGLATQF